MRTERKNRSDCVCCGKWSKTSIKTECKQKYVCADFCANQISPDAIITPGAVSLLTMFPEAYGFSETWRWRCNEQYGCRKEKNNLWLSRMCKRKSEHFFSFYKRWLLIEYLFGNFVLSNVIQEATVVFDINIWKRYLSPDWFRPFFQNRRESNLHW